MSTYLCHKRGFSLISKFSLHKYIPGFRKFAHSATANDGRTPTFSYSPLVSSLLISFGFWNIIGFINFVKQRKAVESYCNQLSRETNIKPHIMMWMPELLYSFLSLELQKLSALCTALLSNTAYPPLSTALIRLYHYYYNINLENCYLKNLNDYKTLTDLFVRSPDLSKFTVPKHTLMISPCEGTVEGLGQVERNHKSAILKIKGQECSLYQLLGFNEGLFDQFSDRRSLNYLIIYLSPGDLHRFYGPIGFSHISTTQITGFSSRLMSKYDFRSYATKLCLNHRVVLSGTSDWGTFLLVPVGARNVGSIRLTDGVITFLILDRL